MTVPHDTRFRRGQLLQGSQGCLGALLLDDPQNGVHDDDRHDGRGVDPLAEQGGNHRRHDEQDDDKVIELLPQEFQEARAGRLGQLVETIVGLPVGDLRAGQAAIVDFEMLNHFLGRQ